MTETPEQRLSRLRTAAVRVDSQPRLPGVGPPRGRCVRATPRRWSCCAVSAASSRGRGHKGTVVKRLGDGVMAVFAELQQAVDAALDANAGLEHVEVAGHRPRMRAGVGYGSPRRLAGDYLGVDVTIVARVGAAAGVGQVLASDAVCEHLDEVRVRRGRGRKLKASGAPREPRVHAITRAGG